MIHCLIAYRIHVVSDERPTTDVGPIDRLRIKLDLTHLVNPSGNGGRSVSIIWPFFDRCTYGCWLLATDGDGRMDQLHPSPGVPIPPTFEDQVSLQSCLRSYPCMQHIKRNSASNPGFKNSWIWRLERMRSSCSSLCRSCYGTPPIGVFVNAEPDREGQLPLHFPFGRFLHYNQNLSGVIHSDQLDRRTDVTNVAATAAAVNVTFCMKF
jgi:hypothetical protein